MREQAKIRSLTEMVDEDGAMDVDKAPPAPAAPASKPPPAAAAANKDDDDEVDPLEAFMAGIGIKRRKKERKKLGRRKN
jgi:hypothetical protein